MIDFTVWDSLLHQYVDQQGRVNYRAWKQEQPQALAHWLSSLEQLDLSSELTRSQQLALWINLYNAFTISKILQRYPIASVRPLVLGIPNWFAFFRFFFQQVHPFGHQIYSLAQIENHIL
ncbi:MAG TPA: DUF547 domain-containing protein, partial [Coleofasciculaceae cyanobacterium]